MSNSKNGRIKMDDIINIFELKKKISKFADDREWIKYHSPKNLSMALSVEAAELMEIFQWMTGDESLTVEDETQRSNISDELADIFVYVVRIADRLDINLSESIKIKMKKNAEKYPAELVRGSSKKYTEY